MPTIDPPVAVSVIPSKIPFAVPTNESLLAEAATLGDAFSEVTSHPADLVADADEMLLAKGDVADLVSREYPVSDGMFVRVALLRAMLAPSAAQQVRQVEAGKAKTAGADDARARLIAIRGEIANIGKAASLPAGVFSLETKVTHRLNVVMMKMDEVLINVQAYWAQLPDKVRLQKLVTEARALIDDQRTLRQSARLMRSDRSLEGLKQARVERMLLDVMQHLSAQGLAAYPGDAVREVRYRLDHVYGRKASKVADPGAGDVKGDPEA